MSGLRECDLVMKGGITSGVVYPRAVMVLGERYRFRSIGGTSAGAIAAAVTAAAEYGRQTGATEDLSRIDAVVRDLATPGLLLGLFQPAPENQPLWNVVRTAAGPGKAGGKVVEAIVRLLQARPLVALTGFIGLLTLGVAAGVGFATLDVLPAILFAALALLLAVLVFVATIGVAAWRLGQAAYEALRGTGFGFCPGLRQPGGPQKGLTDWLHKHIQDCAGLPYGKPLTFGMLESKPAEVTLEMLTTDLSLARPLRCREDLGQYCFEADAMRSYLPEPVIAAMVEAADRNGTPVTDPRGRVLRRLPADGLPVLAAVRLSLSFPGLLSAVPLYRDGERHLFSDGGIASNFPIHFFDSWFPGRPTFGLDLAELPNTPGAEPVVLPTDPEKASEPRWSDVEGIGDFLVRIKDTMQNWRDNSQAELPGYRDRICKIRLTRDEGGLNLDMDPTTIERLVARGATAGEKLVREFRFQEHRWIRFVSWMRLVQCGLQEVDAKFEDFGNELKLGMPEARYFREAYPSEWCAPAESGTRRLLDVATAWGPPPRAVNYDVKGGPLPNPVMRIVPDV